MLIEDGVECVNNFGSTILWCRNSIIGRPRQTDTATTALHGHTVLSDQIVDGFTLI